MSEKEKSTGSAEIELKACPFCGGTASLTFYDAVKSFYIPNCKNLNCPAGDEGCGTDTPEEAAKIWNQRQPDERAGEHEASIYVLVAVDEDSRVKECIPISDLETASVIERILMDNYGGANVCKASRKVNDIPFLIQRRMMIDKTIADAKQELGGAGSEG